MKNRLLEIRPKVIAYNDDFAASRDDYQILLLNYFIYKCLSVASTKKDFDLDEYTSDSAKAVFNYLSLSIPNISSNISFVIAFYNSYIMFDEKTIISSSYDPTSVIYEDSIESLLARVLALGNKRSENFINEVLDILENLL